MEKTLNERLVEALQTRYPQKSQLTGILSDLLRIEKEAVYRRLRSDVSFTFAEVARICTHLNMSADELIAPLSVKDRPFNMKMVDFLNPTAHDYQMMEEFVTALSNLSRDPRSEFGGALNILPQSLVLPFEHIYRFYLFKWKYQYSGPPVSSYREIGVPERFKEINRQIVHHARNAGTSYYIWDKLIFQYLVNDIQYFVNIRLIPREEVEKLKNELLEFLDYLLWIAHKGSFGTKGNRVRFYITSINFESSYSYFESSEIKMTMFKTFTLNDATSHDEKIFARTKEWMNSLKRTSTLISESGEVPRIRFFRRQREIVSQL